MDRLSDKSIYSDSGFPFTIITQSIQYIDFYLFIFVLNLNNFRYLINCNLRSSNLCLYSANPCVLNVAVCICLFMLNVPQEETEIITKIASLHSLASSN